MGLYVQMQRKVMGKKCQQPEIGVSVSSLTDQQVMLLCVMLIYRLF